MQSSDIPALIPTPFAKSGLKNTIPENGVPPNPNNATFDAGFPAITMQPISSGGLPPYGQDMNGILNAVTKQLQWSNAGGVYVYDSTFANDANVNGYPKGAFIQKANRSGFWVSTADNNKNNPDTGGANWVDAASLFTNIPVVSSMAALRLQPKTGPSTVLATGYYTPADGGGGSYSYISSDVTSGAVITASTSGTTLTVTAVASGALSVGQLISRSDTGVAVGYITALGTGSGGTGTYTLSASGTIGSMTMMADNGGTVIVAADGGRWYLNYEYINASMFGVDMTGVSNADYQFNSALISASALTSGGKGATLYLGEGVITLTKQFTVPDRVKIVGAGARSTIINSSYAGAKFVFDGITMSGISKLRLGMGTNASEQAISIITTSADVRWCLFEDLEIASSALTSGQKGIVAITSGGHIITENRFTGIITYQVDQPWIWTGPEGNFITDATIANFGAVARTAFNSAGNANFIQMRIAGSPAAGSVGYAEAALRNVVDVIVDIGSGSTAVNITGTQNSIRLCRPNLLTPVGSFNSGSTVIDSDFTALHRISVAGTTPTSAQFSLSGFGSGATVTGISGSDSRITFTVNSLGTGQAANPTINYSFLEGSWPRTPIIQVTRDGGNQNTAPMFGSSASTTGWGTRMGTTPVAGESYVFIVSVQ